jgi:hypothetical protein
MLQAMFVHVAMAKKLTDQFGLTPATPAPPPALVETTQPDGSIVEGFKHSPIPGATQASPLWALNTPLSMLLYLSTSPSSEDVHYTDHPLVKWDGLTYGNWKDERSVDLLVDVPESVRLGNGSWWIETVLVKGGGDAVGKSPREVARSRKGKSSRVDTG